MLAIALTLVALQIRFSVSANILSSIDRELTSMARHASRVVYRGLRNQRGRDVGTVASELISIDTSLGVDPAASVPNGGTQRVPGLPAVPNLFRTEVPVPVTALPVTGAARRLSAIPNVPATRIFVNSTRSPSKQPLFDTVGYTAAMTDLTDHFRSVQTGSRSYRILTHIGNDRTHVVVQCSFPLVEMQRAVHSLDITLLTAVPLVLIISAFGGALLTDRAIRPVREIALAAASIGSRDLSRRLPVHTQDEFSQLAGTFNDMLARLEATFDQQRRFTSDASHELKSPLTIIKMNTGVALKSTRTPAEYIKSLQAIDRASTTMKVLVDDLLLLARADEGRLFENTEPVYLHSVLAEAVGQCERPDAAKVEMDVSKSLTIVGNRYELYRVFTNLLDNALRHTPPSGSVKVSAIDEDIAVTLKVADTGEGIPHEHLQHLGERFYKVDRARARTHGGTGLGLAICKSIIDAHKGSLQMQSVEGEGTTVTITLPAIKAPY